MSEQSHAELLSRVQVLEAQLAARDAELETVAEVDQALEVALRQQWSVEQTMQMLLGMARERLGALGVLVRMVDDDQSVVDHVIPDDGWAATLDLEALCAEIERAGRVCQHDGARTILGYRLDMDDAFLGSVLVSTHPTLDAEQVERQGRLLELWGEQVDNYLAALLEARRKQRALRALSDALRQPILDHGLDEALEVLEHHIQFEDLVLILRYEERLDYNTINYRIISPTTTLRGDQTWELHQGDAPMVHRDVIRFFEGDTRALVTRLHLSHTRVSAPILAADGDAVLGHISVGVRPEEGLSAFGRDILDRFADYIRHRVVDFSKDWKSLSENFPQTVVRRLLQEDDYHPRYLTPREREVAIMFCDISGFTRMSEQHLKEPELIARLIDRWGARAVEFIWETGGVFDKMVGDCVIGLWGPPFFERSRQHLCHAAADAARRIRDYTRQLMHDEGFPQLAAMDPPIGVATGLNLCTLFVGMFGPGENFTGFSSGMNNTARLQGVAARDEILCMERFCTAYGNPSAFGEAREREVKNVADPLVFRALIS